MAKRTARLIRSVARAAALLDGVAASPDGLSATEAAAAIGTPVPTAHHLLSTLRAAGLLAQDADRRYVLGPQIGVLAEAWARVDVIPVVLQQALDQLAAATGETAYLAAWRDGRIKALASVAGVRAVRVAAAHSGAYEHPHARATGKLLLAYGGSERCAATLGDGPLKALTPTTITERAALERELALVRERGWSEDRDEFVEGVSCVAAPVRSGGVVIAALTVSAPSQRFFSHRDALLAAVLEAAEAAGTDGVLTYTKEAA